METTINFEQRKKDHIQHCLNDKVDVSKNKFSQIKLIHEALPDINYTDVDISKNILGHMFSSPIFVSSMTAGHEQGKSLNKVLAAACEERNWLLNVGSQRRQLSNENGFEEWFELKNKYPNVKMCANLGIAQVITHSAVQIEKVIKSINAIGLIVHLNPLQEVLQVEGTPQFKGGLEKLSVLSDSLSVPLIVKETGCGFSKETLARLNETNIKVVDISGYGGTHWGRVEGLRAESKGHKLLRDMAETFADWGESTLDVLMMSQSFEFKFNLWASGGIRNGLEVAKCLSMGASAVGVARPVLQAALAGKDELLYFMQRMEEELKVSLFCTGSSDINDLRGKWKWTNKN